MYRLEREDFVQSRFVSLWSMLGFQAGFLNAFGFLACGRYVSHVTGFGTQIGVALGSNEFGFAIELLWFPIFFILGATFNGLLTSSRIDRGEKPYFEISTGLIPALILFLLVCGEMGLFGPFGEDLLRPRDFILLFLLSFVCGLQNGCFAVLTKGQIRTTHLTGISTDIGTDLARLWFGKLKAAEHALTFKTNVSRFFTFTAFAFGSIVSVYLCRRMGHFALIVPFASSLFAFAAVRIIGRLLDHRFRRAQESASLAP